MSDYTTHWVRRPAFDDDGARRRTSATLAEAQLIMKMAFIVEPGFRPVGITDAAGRHQVYELGDPRVSEQEYLNHGFGGYDSWATRTVNEVAVNVEPQPDPHGPSAYEPTAGLRSQRPGSSPS